MADEENEEKKEGKISGFFKKMGKKLDDATYDMRLQSDFDKSHKKYTVYNSASVLAITPEISVEEHLDENYLLTLDDDEQIAAGSLIVDSDNGDVIHIVAVEKTELTVEFEGKSNVKPALKIILGEMAQKVEVIKVGNEYYLK
ncbi:MAG: hypothetical protein K2N14_00830 [Clostridia bacterium]|nr:hypothetical protein [Clostridia bacterium]